MIANFAEKNNSEYLKDIKERALHQAFVLDIDQLKELKESGQLPVGFFESSLFLKALFEGVDMALIVGTLDDIKEAMDIFPLNSYLRSVRVLKILKCQLIFTFTEFDEQLVLSQILKYKLYFLGLKPFFDKDEIQIKIEDSFFLYLSGDDIWDIALIRGLLVNFPFLEKYVSTQEFLDVLENNIRYLIDLEDIDTLMDLRKLFPVTEDIIEKSDYLKRSFFAEVLSNTDDLFLLWKTQNNFSFIRKRIETDDKLKDLFFVWKVLGKHFSLETFDDFNDCLEVGF